MLERGLDPDAIHLLHAMAKALHTTGIPAHRLEATLGELAEHMGLEAQFFSTPTSLFLALGPTGQQHVTLLRLSPAEVNLGSISRLDGWVRELQSGEITETELLERLVARKSAKRRPHPALVTAGYALASATAARFFGGGLSDVAISAAVGLTVGLLALLLSRHRHSGHLTALAGALLAATTAGWASGSWLQASPMVVTLAGMLALLPGFTLTVGMTELSTGHLASGTARLAGAAITFMHLGFGVALGAQLVPWTYGPVVTANLPAYTVWIALAISPGALALLLRAAPRDLGIIYLAAIVAFYTARYGTAASGPELGAAAGALAVGLLSNGYARLFDRPASVPLVPGTIMLVPGSVGLRSVMSLLVDDTLGGVTTAFHMTLIAVGIVVGLLAANAIVLPRRQI